MTDQAAFHGQPFKRQKKPQIRLARDQRKALSLGREVDKVRGRVLAAKERGVYYGSLSNVSREIIASLKRKIVARARVCVALAKGEMLSGIGTSRQRQRKRSFPMAFKSR
jgi:hypothetical protein